MKINFKLFSLIFIISCPLFAEESLCNMLLNKNYNVSPTSNSVVDTWQLESEIKDLLRTFTANDNAKKILIKVDELMSLKGISHSMDETNLFIKIKSDFTSEELKLVHPLNRLAARIKLKYNVDLNYFPGETPYYSKKENVISIGEKAALTGNRSNQSLGHEIRHMYYHFKLKTISRDSVFNGYLSGSLGKPEEVYNKYQSLEELGTFSQDLRKLTREFQHLIGLGSFDSFFKLIDIKYKIITFKYLLEQTKKYSIASKKSLNKIFKFITLYNDMIIIENNEITLTLKINDPEIKEILLNDSTLVKILYNLPIKNTFNLTINNYIASRLDEIISRTNINEEILIKMEEIVTEAIEKDREILYYSSDDYNIQSEMIKKLIKLSDKLTSKI